MGMFKGRYVVLMAFGLSGRLCQLDKGCGRFSALKSVGQFQFVTFRVLSYFYL